MRRLLVALGLAAVIGAALLWPYGAQVRALGFEKGWTGGADLLAYLEPAPRNLVWPALDLAPGRSELPHFVGLATLALAILGLVHFLRRRAGMGAQPVVMCALLAAAMGFVFSLGPIVHVGGRRIGTGPYELLYRLAPPLRAMAGPERFGMLVPLGLAVLVGIAVAAVLTRRPRRTGLAVTAALAIFVPLEHWSVPRSAAAVPAGRDLPAVYPWLARDQRTPIVELPLYPSRARKQWAAYLYFSTHHWRPIPVGRTSFYPPAHEFLVRMLEGFPGDSALAALDRLAVDTVVVHPRIWAEAERAARLQALETHPRLRLVQAFATAPDPRFAALALGEERVYRVSGRAPEVRPCVPADALPRDGWTFASSGINKEDRARDGDRRTAWHTAQPQRPGDYLEVRLAQAETIAAVGLGLYYPYDELPHNPVIVVEGEDGVRRRVEIADGPAEQRAVLDALLERPREAEWALRFLPIRARAVRIQVGWREEDPSWPAWSVPELQVYRSCR
jgi:hypothetical protein